MTGGNDLLVRRTFSLLLDALAERLPYLGPIFYGVAAEPDETIGRMGTDGEKILYAPEWVWAQMKEGLEEVLARTYLHTAAHCLLGHVWQAPQSDLSIWDQRCDVEAERLAASFLGLKRSMVDPMADPGAGDALRRDDHARWPRCREEGAGGPDAGEDKGKALWQSLLRSVMSTAPTGMTERLMKSALYGDMAGECGIRVRAAGENESEYTSLLRSYMTIKERRREDTESLDLSFYTLGMEIYGNIPLIEYPELSERPALDDIVIAVDVSGSCGGRVASRFLRETCNIIRDMEIGCEPVNLRLIECDTEIQRETVIGGQEDIPELEERDILGFGGTSFVPVFRRVQELLDAGEIHAVRCLIYLTDGDGEYPPKAPGYDVIFVEPAALVSWFGVTEKKDWIRYVYLSDAGLSESEAEALRDIRDGFYEEEAL